MTQPILNPVKLPSDLNPAERKFAACLAEGTRCLIGGGDLPEKPIESGDSANVVRGETVRFFAYGGDPDGHPVRGPVIELRGAWIDGELDLTHASIPYALLFSNCHFASSVDMQHAECVALYLGGSHLAQGLNASGLTTKGDVNLCAGFSANGEVRVLGADIGGNLSCVGGKFYNPKGYALSADELTVKGSVFLSAREEKGKAPIPFSADGEVRLLGANIGGNLDCVGGKFRNPSKRALDVQNGSINGGLLWRKASGDGVVFLGHAKAGVLVDELDSWKPFKVFLDGFTYDRFAHPADADSRIKWLANRPAPDEWNILPFSPLPYEQAAKVLFGMGHDNAAREILLEKERLQTADKRTPLLRKIGRTLWDVFAGYGYRLRYTAAWMAFFFLFGAAVFAFADYHGNIVPTHPVVALSEDYKAKVAPDGGLRPTRAVPPEYPAFNPVVFSLDVFTPSAVFHQEDSWGPRSGGGDWLSPDVDILWLLTGWYWLQVAAGWVLVPLFLLSVTGVLRPRQSSGEKG